MGKMHSRQRRVLLLVDGNALVHRAFHALPPLTTSRTGEMVNAVYGFANTLFKIVANLKPSHWAIAFDYPAPTFRHAMFDQYKAQRPPTPEELKSQIRRVHEFAEVLGMPTFEVEGFEADDVLGTLAAAALGKGIESAVLTGDRDLLQVVRPGVVVLLPGRNFSEAVEYDEAAVEGRFGVTPGQLTAYKALVGDSSDNIPGVNGVGEKTAARIIAQFGSIDALYQHLDDVTPQKLRESLAASREQVKTSQHLATIVTDVPVELVLDDCRVGRYNQERVLRFLKELEFNSLVGRLPRPADEDVTVQPPAVEVARTRVSTVLTSEDTTQFVNALEHSREVVICPVLMPPETVTPTRPRRSAGSSVALRGLGVSAEQGHLVYVPLETPGNGAALLFGDEGPLRGMRATLEKHDYTKVSDDVKSVLRHLSTAGVRGSGAWFDISVAAHLAGDKAVSLSALALDRLGVSVAPMPPDTVRSAAMSDQEVGALLIERADACRSLRAVLESEMTQRDVLDLFRQVEMPLIPVLAEMENNGILVDTPRLWAMSRTLGEQLNALEIDIYNAVGHRFNINSPKQLGIVLFDELGLRGGRKTSSGHSTEASLLEPLRGAHPVIDLVLQYRQLAKLKSTYVDTLPGLVNATTGRIHTVFSQTSAATGRLASSEPNLQNLPIRTELGRTIRAAVVAPRGWTLLSADYSQIDLRALAHLSQDQALKTAFLNDEDIHTATASRVFGVEPQDVTPDMRRAAKVVNFGVIYGMSDYGLEQATDLSRAEAGRFIKAYFEQYPGVQRWLEHTKISAQEKLYVTTLLGRRRYVPEIRSSNRQVREAAERMAINAPVQGTSADIIKVAMIRIHAEMRRREMQSRMLLQIHDELLFESPGDELAPLSALVRELMRDAIRLAVPLKVDLKAGPNWAEMTPIPS